MFRELENEGYDNYLRRNPFHLSLGINLHEYTRDLHSSGGYRNRTQDPWTTVDPSNSSPYRAEIDDLTRLHYLVTSRKVTTVLEFGVGFSTKVF